jgi:hypothetical protein
MRAKRGVLLIGVAVTLALLVGSTALWAQGKGNKGKLPDEIPMTATFTDDASDGITSDVVDKPYVDGKNGVRAVLVGARNFVLDTRNSPRSFHVNFADDCADELDGPVNFFSTSRLIDGDGNLVEDRLLGMAVDDSFRSDAQAFFVFDDTQYFVRFDPDYDKGGASSDHVQITRLSPVEWNIDAGYTVDGSDTASLLSWPIKGRPKTTFVADCEMPFELMVECVNSEDCPVPIRLSPTPTTSRVLPIT